MPSSYRESATKCEWWFCVAIDTTLSVDFTGKWTCSNSRRKIALLLGGTHHISIVYISSRCWCCCHLLEKTFPSHLPKKQPKTLVVPKKQQRRGEEVNIIIIIIMARRGGKKTQLIQHQYGGFSDANANDTFRGGSGFGAAGLKAAPRRRREDRR